MKQLDGRLLRPPRNEGIRLDAPRGRILLAYAALAALVLGTFSWISARGVSLTVPVRGVGELHEAVAQGGTGALFHVLLALCVIVAASRLAGAAVRYIGQPAVIGEVVSGLLLGPSALGWAFPAAQAFILPTEILPTLSAIAQVGAILYMFLTGLELDVGGGRHRADSVALISHASIVLPFVLGAVLALGIYPKVSSSDVPFLAFTLFMGVAMSVTAFPVLARILRDRHMEHTALGVIAISCAAVDDVTAWCLLAVVLAVTRSTLDTLWLTLGLSAGYLAIMFFVARPLLRALARSVERSGAVSGRSVALVLFGLLASAAATEYAGVHAILGAFLVGALIPANSLLARALHDKVEDLALIVFLPVFFAISGVHTELDLVSGASNWAICGAILLAACIGKFGGSALAGRLSGMGWRDALALGALMNTRGLMELVVLNVGLELGVISPTLFAMMVIMALLTTFMTAPTLDLLGATGAPRSAAPLTLRRRLAVDRVER